MPLKIESPIPVAIALGAIFDIAAACGIVSLAVATALRAPDRQTWAADGAVVGFWLGVLAYLISLLAQLL